MFGALVAPVTLSGSRFGKRLVPLAPHLQLGAVFIEHCLLVGFYELIECHGLFTNVLREGNRGRELSPLVGLCAACRAKTS